MACVLSAASPGRSAALWERLPGLEGRICICAGQEDRKYVSLAYELEEAMMRDTKPGLQVSTKIIQKAGHAVHLEQPDTIAGLLTDLIDASL